jgi:hypothetical protein
MEVRDTAPRRPLEAIRPRGELGRLDPLELSAQWLIRHAFELNRAFITRAPSTNHECCAG